MDIDLLSKMVKELILDNERVVLPGLGSFVAEIVPATFSDKGYTINPPYRKLYFRSKPDEGSDLIPFYAKSNSVSEEIAEKVIVDFVAELKAVLFQKKTVIFPGLGRLRATKENNVFFVADEDLDIYPEGFGLEPISLKTHTATAVEVKEAVTGLKSILSEPVPEVMLESASEEVSEPVAEVVAEPVPEVVPEPEPEVAPELNVEVAVESEVVEVADEPVSAELIVEPEVAEVQEQEAVVETVQVVQEPVAVPVSEKPVAKPAKKRSGWKVFFIMNLLFVLLVGLLFAAYVAVGHFCPEWIDQFLYTPEELEILNYKK